MVLPSGFLIRAYSTQREQEGLFSNHSLFSVCKCYTSSAGTHEGWRGELHSSQVWGIVSVHACVNVSVNTVVEGNRYLLTDYILSNVLFLTKVQWLPADAAVPVHKKIAKRALYEVLALIHLSGSDKAAAATWLRGAMWQVWESKPMKIKQQQLNANKGRDKTRSWDWWMPGWQRSRRARSPEWPLLWAFFIFSQVHEERDSYMVSSNMPNCSAVPFLTIYIIKHSWNHAGSRCYHKCVF